MSSLRLYKSYMFRDKDPAIDELRTVIQRANNQNRLDHKALAQITEEGGPTVSCMRAWFFGVTKRPTNATLEAAGRAIGYQRVWVKRKSNGHAK
jgi:hypothetical protein